MANKVDADQTSPQGAVWCGFTLFAHCWKIRITVMLILIRKVSNLNLLMRFWYLSSFRPDMTEKLLTGTLSLNTNKTYLHTCMRSHPMGLHIRFSVRSFFFLYSLCVWTAKILARLQMRSLAWAFAVRLCDKYHSLMSWLICFLWSTVLNLL